MVVYQGWVCLFSALPTRVWLFKASPLGFSVVIVSPVPLRGDFKLVGSCRCS